MEIVYSPRFSLLRLTSKVGERSHRWSDDSSLLQSRYVISSDRSIRLYQRFYPLYAPIRQIDRSCSSSAKLQGGVHHETAKVGRLKLGRRVGVRLPQLHPGIGLTMRITVEVIVTFHNLDILSKQIKSIVLVNKQRHR